MTADIIPIHSGGPRRAVAWSHLWDPALRGAGRELLLLGAQEARGDVLAIGPEGNATGCFQLLYELSWDARWRIERAHIRVETPRGGRALNLEHDGAGNWTGEGEQPWPELAGCLELDLWPTPFTNTFPLRRLDLAIGARREIDVAYIEAPELTVTRRMQAYTRLDERRYRFESLDRDFSAELTVDAQGIVVNYEGLFERLV